MIRVEFWWASDLLTGAKVRYITACINHTRSLICNFTFHPTAHQPGGDTELRQLLRVSLVLRLLSDLLCQVTDLTVIEALHFYPPFEIILPEFKFTDRTEVLTKFYSKFWKWLLKYEVTTVYFAIRTKSGINPLRRNYEILWLTILAISISSLNTFVY